MIGRKNLTVTESETPGMAIVKGNCVFTGNEYQCEVPFEGLKKWQEGELIQAALPNVTADDREFLISGISPAGWKSTFG
jgi:hypothetical protein